MFLLSRLPSVRRHGRQLELVNTIFPVGENGVFEGICIVQTRDSFDTGRMQLLARPVSDKQFLAMGVPQSGGSISVISIMPDSGKVVALVRDSENQKILSIYSPELNCWKPLPLMIVPRNMDSFSAAVIGDFLYVAGGFPTTGSIKSITSERLDLRSLLRWERIPSIIEPVAVRKGFAMDDYFVIIHSFVCHSSAAEVFYPTTNRCSMIPNFLPEDAEHFTVAVLKNELYMLKWSDEEPSGALLRFNKPDGGWVFLDKVPDFKSKFCSMKQLCPVGNELWIIDCLHTEAICECNKIFSENCVWHVFEGPSFQPTMLENIDGAEAQSSVHACKIGDTLLWRTIPIFCM